MHFLSQEKLQILTPDEEQVFFAGHELDADDVLLLESAPDRLVAVGTRHQAEVKELPFDAFYFADTAGDCRVVRKPEIHAETLEPLEREVLAILLEADGEFLDRPVGADFEHDPVEEILGDPGRAFLGDALLFFAKIFFGMHGFLLDSGGSVDRREKEANSLVDEDHLFVALREFDAHGV